MSSHFNFDDAIFAATRGATTGRAAAQPTHAGIMQLNTGYPSGLPTATDAGYHRSASATSLPTTAGFLDDGETVGSLLAQWGAQRPAAPAAASITAPNSATSTPGVARGHGVPAPGAAAQLNFGTRSAHTSPNVMPGQGAVSLSDMDAHSLEHLQRKLAQEAQRLAALEAEEAQIAAEERMLQAQLRETTTAHRSIDAAMHTMQQEWADVHMAERALRLEPVVDLSGELSHAEGTVEMLRARFDEVAAKHEVMQAQLAVVAQVEAHKTQQRERLDKLAAKVKQMAERRASIVCWCEQQAALEAARERIVADASVLLKRADRAAAAAQQQKEAPATVPVSQPASATANLPPPALKGSRAAALAAAASALPDPVPAREPSAASANLLQGGSESSRAASCAAQARAQSAGALSNGISFALDLDDDELTASDADLAAFGAGGDFTDITGGVSFALPTAATVTGSKRNRHESVASAIVA